MLKKIIILLTCLISLPLARTLRAMCIPCGVTEVAGSPYTTGVVSPHQVVYSPDSRWLAVTNFGSNTVSIFSVDAETCELTLTYTVPTGGALPIGLAYSPDGSCLAATNFVSNDISIFSVDQTTGAITLLGLPVPTGGFQPIGVDYSPDGTCLAVVNEFDTVPFAGTGSLSIFTVDPTTCAITLIGAPITTGLTNPTFVDYSPDGLCLAVANLDAIGGPGSVSIFSVDPITCSVTLVGAPVSTGGLQPAAAVYSPDGTHLAVSNSALLSPTMPGSISIFSVDPATCSITLMGAPVATGGDTPFLLSYSPDGRCLTVANLGSDNMTIFSVNPTTGDITPIGPPIATGSFPVIVTYSPDNLCLAVANSGFNPIMGFPPPGTIGSISVFQTNFIDPSLLANQSPIVKAIFAKYCPVCALIT